MIRDAAADTLAGQDDRHDGRMPMHDYCTSEYHRRRQTAWDSLRRTAVRHPTITQALRSRGRPLDIKAGTMLARTRERRPICGPEV